jgi:hypothetical protein
MSQELHYTSAPRGLKSTSRGYCTVARTADMPALLADRLEGLSGYRQIFPPNDARAADNPVVYSHLRLNLGARDSSILSRVSFAGLDYTDRSNKYAHHIVLDAMERPTAGPAWVAAQPGFFDTEWHGEPRILAEGRRPPSGEPPAGICRAWAAATGDPGWAGVAAEAFLADPKRLVIFVIDPGLDLLPLFVEAIALLPDSRRWEVGFSTYCTNLPNDLSCSWRGVLRDSPEALSFGKLPDALMVDLSRSMPPATGGELVELARTGIRPIHRRKRVGTVPVESAPTSPGISPPVSVGRAVASSFSNARISAPNAITDVPASPRTESPRPSRLAPGARSRNSPVHWGPALVVVLLVCGCLWLVGSNWRKRPRSLEMAEREAASATTDRPIPPPQPAPASRKRDPAGPPSLEAKTASEASPAPERVKNNAPTIPTGSVASSKRAPQADARGDIPVPSQPPVSPSTPDGTFERPILARSFGELPGKPSLLGGKNEKPYAMTFEHKVTSIHLVGSQDACLGSFKLSESQAASWPGLTVSWDPSQSGSTLGPKPVELAEFRIEDKSVTFVPLPLGFKGSDETEKASIALTECALQITLSDQSTAYVFLNKLWRIPSPLPVSHFFPLEKKAGWIPLAQGGHGLEFRKPLVLLPKPTTPPQSDCLEFTIVDPTNHARVQSKHVGLGRLLFGFLDDPSPQTAALEMRFDPDPTAVWKRVAKGLHEIKLSEIKDIKEEDDEQKKKANDDSEEFGDRIKRQVKLIQGFVATHLRDPRALPAIKKLQTDLSQIKTSKTVVADPAVDEMLSGLAYMIWAANSIERSRMECQIGIEVGNLVFVVSEAEPANPNAIPNPNSKR